MCFRRFPWTGWPQKGGYSIKLLNEPRQLTYFLSASSLCSWQGHKAHFSVIEPTVVYVTTDRSALQARETERVIWSLHVLAPVTWHHVPLYCDVVIGGEEMKCLEAIWDMCVYVCVCICVFLCVCVCVCVLSCTVKYLFHTCVFLICYQLHAIIAPIRPNRCPVFVDTVCRFSSMSEND